MFGGVDADLVDVTDDGETGRAGEEGNATGRAVDFCAGDVDDDQEKEDEEGGSVGGAAEGVEKELDCSVDHVGRTILCAS